ncbi:hypothetical protein JL09_g6182, partial [Pichia kudriavzevii]
FEDHLVKMLPQESYGLIQPNHQDNNDTGTRAPKHIMRSKPAVKTVSTFWL